MSKMNLVIISLLSMQTMRFGLNGDALINKGLLIFTGLLLAIIFYELFLEYKQLDTVQEVAEREDPINYIQRSRYENRTH